jgi:hypothetical protein
MNKRMPYKLLLHISLVVSLLVAVSLGAATKASTVKKRVPIAAGNIISLSSAYFKNRALWTFRASRDFTKDKRSSSNAPEEQWARIHDVLCGPNASGSDFRHQTGNELFMLNPVGKTKNAHINYGDIVEIWSLCNAAFANQENPSISIWWANDFSRWADVVERTGKEYGEVFSSVSSEKETRDGSQLFTIESPKNLTGPVRHGDQIYFVSKRLNARVWVSIPSRWGDEHQELLVGDASGTNRDVEHGKLIITLAQRTDKNAKAWDQIIALPAIAKVYHHSSQDEEQEDTAVTVAAGKKQTTGLAKKKAVRKAKPARKAGAGKLSDDVVEDDEQDEQVAPGATGKKQVKGSAKKKVSSGAKPARKISGGKVPDDVLEDEEQEDTAVTVAAGKKQTTGSAKKKAVRKANPVRKAAAGKLSDDVVEDDAQDEQVASGATGKKQTKGAAKKNASSAVKAAAKAGVAKISDDVVEDDAQDEALQNQSESKKTPQQVAKGKLAHPKNQATTAQDQADNSVDEKPEKKATDPQPAGQQHIAADVGAMQNQNQTLRRKGAIAKVD